MQSEIDPPLKELLEMLATHSTVQYSMPLGDFASWQSIFFYISAVSFLACGCLAVVARFIAKPVSSEILWGSLGFYTSGFLFAFSLSLGQIPSLWRQFTQPVSSFLKLRIEPIEQDYKLLSKLKAAPTDHLQFLNVRLQTEAEHLRGRVGILVGAIDKVGIVPLLAGGLISGWKFRKETNFCPGFFEIALAVLGILYLIGVVSTLTSQRLAELAELVQLAVPEIQ